MKVVTTCHKAGFDEYGHRWVDSIQNWPAAEFCMYGEGFGDKRCEGLLRLTAFKERHAQYKPPSWRYDIVKFSNKVFAAYDALYNHDGLGVWLDADAVTYRPIPEGYIESLLPEGCYMAHFKRHHYTETGFWIVDCTHERHKEFFDYWLGWFETDSFKNLPEWHDCTTLDATIRALKVKTHSLSGEFEGNMNPLAHSNLSKYIQHLKGPRKGMLFDPDNANARAFYEAQHGQRAEETS
jgi:hypothetical protein